MASKGKRKRIRARNERLAERPKLVAVGPAGEVPGDGHGEEFQRRTQVAITLCALLAVVTFAVYFRATQNPFVNYDDQGYVVENTKIQHGLNLESVRWALTSTDATNWHPLTWISHIIEAEALDMAQPAPSKRMSATRSPSRRRDTERRSPQRGLWPLA